MEAEVTTETTASVRTRVTPFVTSADGGVRAGVLATLVDVVGGAIAARVLRPDWLATADLSLQLVGTPPGAFVEARGSVLRRGRTTLVVEALVVALDEGGDDVLVDGRPADPVAWASMTFAVLPAQNPGSSVQMATELPVRWAFSGGALEAPIMEVLPVTVVDATAGRLSLPVRPYLHNSFGAVQGGVIALLAEASAVEALGASRGGDGCPMVVTDLQIAYLALGRVGPIVTEARVLGTGPDGRASAVVELRDAGADGRLTTVVNVAAAPASVLSGASR
ncbi:MAG: PaaI family thioesterase [Acidimicrobiales bacterium]|jgi:acyl-coenzyme A thioesterase PaaI-like protein